MDKPQRRKLEKNSRYLEYDKGYNHSYDEYDQWILERLKSLKCKCQDCRAIGINEDIDQLIREVEESQ